MFTDWITSLHDLDFSATEMAEATWLCLVQQRFATEGMGSAIAEPDTSPAPSPPAPEPLRPSPSTSGSTSTTPPAPEQQTGIFPQPRSPQPPQERSLEPRLPIKVMRAAALGDPLQLMRALRPLMRMLPTGRPAALDEQATAQRIAEEQLYTPVFQLEVEPWLELALVIDESPSMLIWRQTIIEFVRLLKHYGLFRDVRVWGLITSEPTVYIRPEWGGSEVQQSRRDPRVLIDPKQRRLVWVMTDCVSQLWREGWVFETLRMWSETGPLALLQVLPEWMWQRTALRHAQRVMFRSLQPVAANRDLVTVGRISAAAPGQLAIPTPVVPLAATDLAQWSAMLSGRSQRLAAGVEFYPQIQAFLRQREQGRQLPAADLTASERVARFQASATRSAQRLAGLLAAAPVINLQVIRLIQELFMARSQPVHVAEVVLGGLLKPAIAPTPEMNPDTVEYQFITPEIRRLLLAQVPVPDTTEILMAVSRRIHASLGKATLDEFVAELRVWLAQEGTAESGDVQPFATVAAAVLRRRGPRYAAFVEQVERRYGNGAVSGRGAALFPPLETIRFTAARLEREAETLGGSFPPLQTDEVEVVKFVRETETQDVPLPPTLQTDRVRVVKLSVAESAPELETFEFTVAKLVHKRTGFYNQTGLLRNKQWVVEKHPGQAQRFIEQLPGGVPLEMVAIPGGTFVMGSPENETGHLEIESPQHLVTVAPFFMGRYPVTQKQWSIVVEQTEQIEYPLDPNPSHFSGEQLPVEQVSWNEAVEFCRRLSKLTGQDYCLPSEAEWEYACRAVTSTQLSTMVNEELTIEEWNKQWCEPFHFGDIITTPVAQYAPDGERDYTAQYSGETKPVGHFEISNDFGLSDMHGNVWEWCSDHWHRSYEDAPVDGSSWLTNDLSDSRILRGGSWGTNPRLCRSACRSSGSPNNKINFIGFRLVCSNFS